MPNVVSIVRDERVRRQIEQFLTELDVDDLRFATFENQKEFEHLYFRDRRKIQVENPDDPNPPAPTSNDEVELKLFSEINLFIFAMDSVNEKPPQWIETLRNGMKRYKSWPADNTLRVILLKYEEDGISKLDLMHPLLDDIIYLPLDRLVFLQKMQIFATLPKRVTPRYLFIQEVKHPIEISRIVKMDRFSDVGLAIRNPVPLKKGLPGNFYIDFPADKARLSIRGKVIGCEPHPEIQGQYLVYFAYFGLSKGDLTLVRKILSKMPGYRSLTIDDREHFRTSPDSLFLDENEKQSYGIVILDPDENAGTSLARIIDKDMDRLQVLFESSFYVFMNKFLDTSGKDVAAGAPLKATDAVDFYAAPFTLTISAHDLKVVSVSPPTVDSHLFLGHPALATFASPDRWITLIQEKQAKLMIDEAVQLVLRGRVIKKLLAVQDAQGMLRGVNFKFFKGASDQVVMVELSPATAQEIQLKQGSTDKSQSLEAFIVDTNFAPEDPAGWVDNIRTRAMKVGLTRDPQRIKFILISENENRSTTHWLNSPDIHGLVMKPVDVRQLLFLLSENLPNKHTMYRFDNLGWANPALPIHVSKGVELEAISEFGATIKSQQPIAPGTMIFLRKSIYENAPNQCLASRVYICTQHPKDKSSFQILVSYFGITDGFLKYCRTWIRENYTQQKGQSII